MSTLLATGTGQPPQTAQTNFVRVFVVGGAYAYRALFAWANPYVYVPIMLGEPIFQILFFAYLGRAAHIENDSFFVIGNGIQAISYATLFGMLFTLDGERYAQTLSSILATPANRAALFLGRSLPVMLNGMIVGAWSLLVGSLILGTKIPASAVAPLVITLALAVFSSAGCGFVIGSLSLRYRNGLVLANTLSAFLLLCTGANIPRGSLPEVLRVIGDCLPLTHAIQAARDIVAGASLGDVSQLLTTEAAIGLAYALTGFILIRYFEQLGRRKAAFETA
jgi:ABC-2 type transport system permease protein